MSKEFSGTIITKG